MGRSDGQRPRHRRDASAARTAVADEEAFLRNAGKSLRNRPFARLLAAANHAATAGREAAQQEPLPFLDEHPLIRPLDDYAAIVAQAFHRQADRPSVGEGLERHDRAMRPGSAQESPGDLLDDRALGGVTAPIWLSLAGLHLCRARLRFTRQSPL